MFIAISFSNRLIYGNKENLILLLLLCFSDEFFTTPQRAAKDSKDREKNATEKKGEPYSWLDHIHLSQESVFAIAIHLALLWYHPIHGQYHQVRLQRLATRTSSAVPSEQSQPLADESPMEEHFFVQVIQYLKSYVRPKDGTAPHSGASVGSHSTANTNNKKSSVAGSHGGSSSVVSAAVLDSVRLGTLLQVIFSPPATTSTDGVNDTSANPFATLLPKLHPEFHFLIHLFRDSSSSPSSKSSPSNTTSAPTVPVVASNEYCATSFESIHQLFRPVLHDVLPNRYQVRILLK